MFGRKRREAEQRRQRIIAELEDLRRECETSADRSYVSDMILYADVGYNRMNLPDDWVSKTREGLAERRAMWEVV